MRRSVLAICGALALLGCGAQDGNVSTMPPEGVAQLSDLFTGEFDLIDKDGQPVRDEAFEGKVMLVYFGFTNCPDVCPGDINVMTATLNILGDDAVEVAPVFISVDPERDTPQALKDYFAFDDRLIPLTGSEEASEAARQAFKVFAQKVPLPDSASEYTVDHTRAFYITDRAGQPQYGVLDGIEPQKLADVLRRTIAD